jgi:phosphate transport system permease protein
MTVDFDQVTTEIPAVEAAAPSPDAREDVPINLHKVSSDELFSAVGSLVGSFCLVWIVFYYILPLGGVLGFLVCWYFTFLAMYAGVTALSHPRPIVVDRLMAAVFIGIALTVGFVLITVVVYTVWRARMVLGHWNFYTKPASAGSLTGPYSKGGISNIILGSLIQLAIAVCISLPLGLGTAIFMTEVGGWFAKVVRTVVEAMTAVPDLLAGLFVYVILILGLHWHRNGLAVSLALSVTMTPIVARSAEVALRVVPGGLREAAQALGASHWRTVSRVVIPTARPGLATALILAVARGIGESAPLLIVSGFTTFANYNPVDGQTMNSLPLYIYECIRSGQPAEIARGFAAASVLLFLVFFLFILTRFLARQRLATR